MMKRLILAALAVVVTLPAAISTQAQDDVYYSRKNSRKQAYESTSNDVWSTKANDDAREFRFEAAGKQYEELLEELA